MYNTIKNSISEIPVSKQYVLEFFCLALYTIFRIYAYFFYAYTQKKKIFKFYNAHNTTENAFPAIIANRQ